MLVTLFIVAFKVWPPTSACSARGDWVDWLWEGGRKKQETFRKHGHSILTVHMFKSKEEG